MNNIYFVSTAEQAFAVDCIYLLIANLVCHSLFLLLPLVNFAACYVRKMLESLNPASLQLGFRCPVAYFANFTLSIFLFSYFSLLAELLYAL